MNTGELPFGVDAQLLRTIDEFRRIEQTIALPSKYLEMEKNLRIATERSTQPIRDIAERLSKDYAQLNRDEIDPHDHPRDSLARSLL